MLSLIATCKNNNLKNVRVFLDRINMDGGGGSSYTHTHTQTRCLSLAHRVINILTHEDTAQQDRLSQQAPTSIGLVLV